MRRLIIALVTVAGVAVIALVPTMNHAIVSAKERRHVAQSARPLLPGYRYIRSRHPDRTAVYDERDHLVATFTEGARTVVFRARTRTFTDPQAAAPVRTDAWVRLAPTAWRFGRQDGAAFRTWFAHEVADASPDLLADAMRYVTGGTDEAGFGPYTEDEEHRVRGADWNDYLGVPWGGLRPDPRLRRDLDCSGYVRLVYGHDMGVPLYADTEPHADGLGRFSRSMAAGAPGVVIADGGPDQLTDLSDLQPGDLVFFALHSRTRIAHMGFYLGRDEEGHRRYVSSRMRADGPTFGDAGGAAVLDGDGYYARHLRVARRL
ncbi:NlpC/P60 family protein [Actinomadura sp. DC4]|uniref:NlpC/P60 family protein n=1 Tax=Actinomadura sp. DC4 TaxID=3055069 RepID=UPI0025AFEE81|nr:NlpC/P60 family protein [Actinomadura sp. DC4]MDN3357195.1 NlpC/P60 family protein [Actinomadura sp. DC4]